MAKNLFSKFGLFFDCYIFIFISYCILEILSERNSEDASFLKISREVCNQGKPE
ncbi:hypothetical protein T4A_12972 [Trichinella pseudospiralis]|uniref:Uncharacterized protein n=1 Tax=Trichinella pseudospiralis TaxID=6337 RepID=A0A0V1EEZ8_TRIPS|nr:hypothetical protein T4A_12972 [Trichinella pseudospiralis]